MTADNMPLIVSLSCSLIHPGEEGLDVFSASGWGWRGWVSGWPDDFEGLLEAREQLRFPEGLNWEASGVASLIKTPETMAPLSGRLPVFVAAPELGVWYWPIVIEAVAPVGCSAGQASAAWEAAMAFAAAAIPGVLGAGKCGLIMGSEMRSGSSSAGWQEAAQVEKARWEAMSRETAAMESCVASRLGARPRDRL